MKNINKLLSVLIAITILFTNISYSKAQNDVKFDKPDDIFYAKKIEEVNLLVNNLENMTENELQQFISNCRRISEDNKKFGNWLVDRINDFGYLNQQIGLLRNIRVDIIVK